VLLECGRRPGDNQIPQAAIPPLDRVAAVIVSHAHHDHAGRLSELLRNGYGGPVVVTQATQDLIAVQMRDAARRSWQADRESAAVLGCAPPPPLSGTVHRSQFRAVQYGQPTDLLDGLRATFGDAGHLLGSASVLLEFDGETPRNVFFSGDVGRENQPFFQLPPPFPAAHLVISESTYGDRLVPTYQTAVEQLGRLVIQTVEAGGRVLIPAFSLGRTQVVLAALAQLWGTNPPAPVWVDSPIAHEYSAVYRQHDHLLKSDAGNWEGAARYAITDAASTELVRDQTPAIIVASGGMCDSARVRRHLRAMIDDPRCGVVLVSHQAPRTLGRRLLERGPTVRFDGRSWNKWAAVEQLAGFSAHADRAELEMLLEPAATSGSAVRLVHGDEPVSRALAVRLERLGGSNAAVPASGSVFELP